MQMDAPSTKVMKRKLSWSWDSYEAEATLAIRRRSALTSKTPESDDTGGTDASNDSQIQDDAEAKNDDKIDPNSFGRQITEPKQGKRTTWPKLPSFRSDQCCQTCEAMTGTPEGLRALLSDERL